MTEEGESAGEGRTAEHAGHTALRGHDVRAVALVDRHVLGARARGRQKSQALTRTEQAILLTDAVFDIIRRDVVRCPRPSVQSSPTYTPQHHTRPTTTTHQT